MLEMPTKLIEHRIQTAQPRRQSELTQQNFYSIFNTYNRCTGIPHFQHRKEIKAIGNIITVICKSVGPPHK